MPSRHALPTPLNATSDEIDLRELISLLWHKKGAIFSLSFLFFCISSLYALSARQVWTSQALISVPLAQQVESLELSIAKLKASIPYPLVEQLDFSSLTRAEIYKSYVVSFNSMDNKKAFLIKEGFFAEEVKRAGIEDKSSERELMNELGKQISAMPSDKTSSDINLIFSAESAELANARLLKYINFIQSQQIVEKNNELRSVLRNAINTLSTQYDNKKADALKTLQDEIVKTKYALMISEVAGVDRPLERVNSGAIFNIDLGSKGLAEKLRILDGIKEPEVLNPELAKFRQQLNSLKALTLIDADFTSFHMIDSPEVPFTRDKPKRPLIVILGTLLGGMLGVAIVLVRHAFRRPEQE
ncbi:Wzz/FepE/Etk N-terminal domain-containing protein [Aeromonas veronii]|uniref:Wzz/FepE/Etk N-terminal domain-containing protein n=1 Tax=Aeromonas veronii TaxID=654 RepID=UPI003D1BAC4C